MSGIFYDPRSRSLHAVQSSPEPGWTLVTHNLEAGLHQCRRIMREWLTQDEVFRVSWSVDRGRRSA